MRNERVTRQLKEAAVALAAGRMPDAGTAERLVRSGLARSALGRNGRDARPELTAAGRAVVAVYEAVKSNGNP